MRRVKFSAILICFLVTIPLTFNSLNAQFRQRGDNGPYRVTGWVDDTHYIFQTLDAQKKPIALKVDIRTGKGVPYTAPKSDKDLISASLPEGNMIGFSDIVSPDNKSVIFVKKNDLYYFKLGDKVLNRMTFDSIPKVNVRFSPDGLKIAYTKNKDLYVFDIPGKKETRLTTDASDRIYNGYSSWVYMEEILGRASRYAAFWWSPDSK